MQKSDGVNSCITHVERLWLQDLYVYCKGVFKEASIPSHDHHHHMRVWALVKMIVGELALQGYVFSENEIQNLIIAVFFHDVGLTKTIGEQHGAASSQMCAAFISKHAYRAEVDLPPILTAIERHDDKRYKDAVYSGDAQKGLASLLCTCDDLDAFGAVGVFRYVEIYLLRGLPVEEFPIRIIPNLESRFENFTKLYGCLPQLYAMQKKRYEITLRWFCTLKKELESGYTRENQSGAIGAFNMIQREVDSGCASFSAGTVSGYIRVNDQFSRNFFESVGQELACSGLS